MLEQPVRNGGRSSLTGLLLPLSDRSLVLPNVAVAELIGYRPCMQVLEGFDWHLGWIDWRNQRLPLISFEAACGGSTQVGERARIVVLNSLGDSRLRFMALLVQGIPRSMKVDDHLQRASAELAPLELDAVQLGEAVVKIPDLIGLEQKLADAGLI